MDYTNGYSFFNILVCFQIADMRPYDLPQNSVFSWDRADIIIENDSNCTCTSENKIIFKVALCNNMSIVMNVFVLLYCQEI